MKLIGIPGDFRTRKIQAVANFLEIPLETQNVKHTALREKEFLKKNPFGKIPVLETNDGFIYESNAILRHLARLRKDLGLYGASLHEEALVDQWLEVSSLELEPAVLALVLPVLGWAPALGDREAIWADINRTLEILNTQLKLRTFLVGNKITIADITIASVLSLGFLFAFEQKVRETYPHVTRWFSLINDQKPFFRVFGKAKFCQKEFPQAEVAAEPKKEKKEKKEKTQEKVQEKPEEVKQECPEGKKKAKEESKDKAKTEKPVDSKPKQQQQPKQTKEKASPKKPKKEEKNDDEEEEKPVKKTNPLDLLPPSKFDLFAFKTLFVNAADKKEALKHFWETFDPAGYSLWFLKYQKAAGEGKNLIHTNNLMGGFLNRLEEFRRYSFAVHGVYGEEPNLEVRGCWVWRGVDHPNEVKELPTYEYHTFEKVNLENPEHKKLVEEYWTSLNEGDVVEGLKAQTVKYFK